MSSKQWEIKVASKLSLEELKIYEQEHQVVAGKEAETYAQTILLSQQPAVHDYLLPKIAVETVAANSAVTNYHLACLTGNTEHLQLAKAAGQDIKKAIGHWYRGNVFNIALLRKQPEALMALIDEDYDLEGLKKMPWNYPVGSPAVADHILEKCKAQKVKLSANQIVDWASGADDLATCQHILSTIRKKKVQYKKRQVNLFHLAAILGAEEVLQKAKDADHNPAERTTNGAGLFNGVTPLMLAFLSDNYTIAAALMNDFDCIVDFNLVRFLVQRDKVAAVAKILEDGFDMNEINESQFFILPKSVEMCQLLVANGWQINKENKRGETRSKDWFRHVAASLTHEAATACLDFLFESGLKHKSNRPAVVFLLEQKTQFLYRMDRFDLLFQYLLQKENIDVDASVIADGMTTTLRSEMMDLLEEERCQRLLANLGGGTEAKPVAIKLNPFNKDFAEKYTALKAANNQLVVSDEFFVDLVDALAEQQVAAVCLEILEDHLESENLLDFKSGDGLDLLSLFVLSNAAFYVTHTSPTSLSLAESPMIINWFLSKGFSLANKVTSKETSQYKTAFDYTNLFKPKRKGSTIYEVLESSSELAMTKSMDEHYGQTEGIQFLI